MLAYLDGLVPVVGSAAGEPGAFFTEDTGVITKDETVWSGEIIRLLGDDSARQRMADAAFGAFADRLSVNAAADRCGAVLAAVAGVGPATSRRLSA